MSLITVYLLYYYHVAKVLLPNRTTLSVYVLTASHRDCIFFFVQLTEMLREIIHFFV